MRRALDGVLGLTSFAAGSVDVLSFAKLGGVLASAMTGNVALLGLYAGRDNAAAALSSMVALIAFILGAGAGVWAARRRAQHGALKLLLAAEFALLLAGASLWLASGRPQGGICANGVVVFLAMAMGVQMIAGRHLNLAGIPTVVFTSTLTNIVTGVTEALARKTRRLPPDFWRQCLALAVYFGGALAAGICVYAGTPAMMFLPVTAVAAALALLAWP
jgi:uncharacterized membrane protein YoaK (UPF0700 family)